MKKNIIKGILLLVVITLACLMFGCTNNAENGKIVSISVDENVTYVQGYDISTFDISQIIIYAKHENTKDENGEEVEGTVDEIACSLSYVKAEDKASLSQVGMHNITIYYNGFTCIFKLKLYNTNVIDDNTFYTVNFYDESGNQLLQTGTIKPGERAVPPTEVPVIENMEFIGWVDRTTNQAVNLNTVSSNLNLKAKYENVSYDVVFTHGDGSTETIKLSRTQSVDESVFPTPKQMDGYTFTNWVSVGTNVYRANYIKNQYDITFKYRSYANNAYSSDIITKTVKYNYDALKIEEISGAKCDGISKNNDFHFIYWYTLNYNNEKVKVEFPYITEKGMYEITFYAEYVDFNVGSEGLVYQEYNDGLIITDYQGNDDIVVIPKKAALAGQRKDVIDIKDGIFKDKNIKEFIVDNDNPYFVSENGVLYKYSINNEEEKNKDILVLYPNMVESTSFTMASTILDIGPYAFANNKYLTEVNLSTSLISISDYAFYNCTKLASIVMPANLTKIETGAFYMEEASNLETVTFSGIELEFINNYAFSGCDKLKTFTLPSSLKQIGVAVFKDCYSLTEINCDKNSYFSSFNGGLYSADFSILYAQPAYYNNGEYNIVINEECKTIYSGAFSKSKAITITIESNNLVFEPGSFNMDNLLAVIYTKKASIDDVGNFANMFNQAFGYRLPKHVYVENSIYDQFENIQLEDVVISSYDSLNLGYGYSNNYLYEINGNSVSIVGYVGTDTELTIANTIGDYNINKISEYAFAYNPYIQKVTIPVGIESIGEYAFQNCINLEEIVLSETSASLLKRIESYAFLDSTRLTRVIASDDFTLDYLGRYAFNGTNYYEKASSSIILGGMYIKYIGHDSEYIIPSNVTYIASDAFKDAGTIVTLSFESPSRIKTIDSYAFMNCVGLTSITFPVSLKTIDSYAFYGCSYLYSVTFNDNQANINVDKDAFYGAGSYYDEGSVYQVFKDSQQYILTFQTTATAVDTDTGIAFVKGRDPKDLTTTQLFMGWYYDENNTQIVKFPIRIDKDTTIYAKVEESTYSSSGFSYDSTTDSNNELSYKITGYSGNDSFVVVPEIYYDKKVISIGENVFGEEVQNIYIRATTDSFGKNISVIKHIGMGAFEKTYWYKNFPGDFVYYDNILIGYKGNATEVVIPDGITLLADGVFSGNTKITKVTFPSTIQRIPDYTFKNCTNLQTIVLSSSINSIGKEAFYGCTNLININFEVITNLNELSYDAFTNTSWLNNQNKDCIIINDILYKYVGSRSILHIPSQVTIIGDYAFAENNTIKNIYLTSAVSSINACAFKDCANLNSINFLSNENNSLISIQEGAFYNCTALTTIDLEHTRLLEIGANAFFNTRSLGDIVLPRNITTISEAAFKQSGITSIVFSAQSSITTLPEYCFYGCQNLQSVDFKGTSSIHEIGAYCFAECTNLSKFNVESASTRVTTLRKFCFYNCINLSVFNVSENYIETIENQALYNLGYIASNNSNLIILGRILISYRGQESELVVPKDITIVYNGALYGNTSIRKVTFESGSVLKSINEEAFYGCTNLEEINIPSTVEYIGYHAFVGSAWYEKLIEENEYLIINGILVKYTSDTPKQAVIPATVKTITKGAFEGMQVYDILIPSESISILDEAFFGIIPVTFTDTESTKNGFTLTITADNPPDLQYSDYIDNCCNIYVLGLESYLINESWKLQNQSIEIRELQRYYVNFVFSDIAADPKARENVYALYSSPQIKVNIGYKFTGWFHDIDCTIPVTYPYFISGGDATVYAKIVDLSVGSNPESFVLENAPTDPTKSTIIAYIPEYEDSSVVLITKQAGKFIISITGHLGYMSTDNTYVGDRYYFNEDLGQFVLFNESDLTIDSSLEKFRRNTTIREISFAKNSTIAILGDNSLAGLVNLETISLPDSIKSILSYAFADCSSLSMVTFDEDITDLQIASNAFYKCTALTSITLPTGLISLEDYAFNGCTNLKEVIISNEKPIMLYGDKLPFGRIEELPDDFVIRVPKGTKNQYTSLWTNYSQFIKEIDE